MFDGCANNNSPPKKKVKTKCIRLVLVLGLAIMTGCVSPESQARRGQEARENPAAQKALFDAVAVLSTDGVESAMRAGASLAAKNQDGQDVLATAILSKADEAAKADFIEFLLHRTPPIPTANRNDALALAALLGYTETAAKLIEAGADVNSMNDKGVRPLMCAVVSLHNVEMVKLLLARGADVNARNRQGKTALYIARHDAIDVAAHLGLESKKEEIIRLLEDEGATGTAG